LTECGTQYGAVQFRFANSWVETGFNKLDTRTLRLGGTLSQQRRICGTPSVLVGHCTPRLPKISPILSRIQKTNYLALLNLCRNASAALQHGGEVVILKNSVPRTGASTGVVEIIVADNGRGMTDEVLRRAFDSNFMTKPVGEGSGLGLRQVQQFVQESSGTIEIKPEVDVGTAVRMLLQPVSRLADGNCVELSNSIAAF
jgi:anti-sigma regulatory factor (Ser/Thr protein kinase)